MGFLNVRIVPGCFKLGDLFVRQGTGQPAEIGGDAAGREVRDEHGIGTLAEQLEKFVVDILIAHAVSEDVHARAQQALGVREIEDVRGNPDAVLVRLVDGSGIQFRGELFELPVAVIDPELDQIDVAGHL